MSLVVGGRVAVSSSGSAARVFFSSISSPPSVAIEACMEGGAWEWAGVVSLSVTPVGLGVFPRLCNVERGRPKRGVLGVGMRGRRLAQGGLWLVLSGPPFPFLSSFPPLRGRLCIHSLYIIILIIITTLRHACVREGTYVSKMQEWGKIRQFGDTQRSGQFFHHRICRAEEEGRKEGAAGKGACLWLPPAAATRIVLLSLAFERESTPYDLAT